MARKHNYIRLSEGIDLDPPPPWDSWELNPKFFNAMSHWTVSHPETTLDRVLDNICDGIDNGKDLVDLIPDSPFPARSLVKALGYLVKFGTVRRFDQSECLFVHDCFQTVSRARAEVHKFAKDVIHWVNQMQLAFESRRVGRFASVTKKKNLEKMRCV